MSLALEPVADLSPLRAGANLALLPLIKDRKGYVLLTCAKASCLR